MPPRSSATIGRIVPTASASDATIVTLRMSPIVSARRPGDQSPSPAAGERWGVAGTAVGVPSFTESECPVRARRAVDG